MRRRPEEQHAGDVMAAVLGGRVVERDPGGGPVQVHDFDLVLPSGERYAVEVTRESSPAYQATLSELDKRDWRFDGLQRNWHLGMGPSYNVKELHQRAPGHLAALESAGISEAQLRSSPDPGEAQEPLNALRALGVRLVYEIGEADGPGSIDVGDAPAGGTTAGSVVVAVANAHLNRADNRAKLEAATDASERHLFVWILSEHYQATAAMHFDLPSDAPALPPFIDAVWIGTGFEPPLVWRYSTLGGWENLGSVDFSA